MNNPEASVPFALPDISEAEIEAVAAVLRSRWITTGAITREFESRFAVAVDAPYAVALNSCTAALHLSLEAMGVGPGDAVFLPTFTFAATGEVVRYVGAQPVLVDVDPVTASICPRALRRALEDIVQQGTFRPRVVMPVHFAGSAAKMEAIWEIAREFGLAVVEDAAHAFPTTYEGHPIGWTPEDIISTVCFSFYATKTITTGEGGMVVTRSAELAERIRLMSLHGLSRQAWNRYSGGTWRYDILAPGYKYNLTDIASAIGLVQLSRAQAMVAKREQIALNYSQAFGNMTCFVLPELPARDSHAWHLFHLRLAQQFSSSHRDWMIEFLQSRGIGTSVHFIPLHIHSYYRDQLRFQPDDFPNAMAVFDHCISLPIYSGMTKDDVSRVICAVSDAHDILNERRAPAADGDTRTTPLSDVEVSAYPDTK